MNGITVDALSWSEPVDRPAEATRKQTTSAAWLSAALVFVAALYAFALCFVNTRVVQVAGSTPLVAVEAAILLVALALLARRLSIGGVVICLALGLNFCVLSIARDNADIKALRDLLMLVIFAWLGFAYGSALIAERLLRTIAWIAVAVGLVELLAPDFYKNLFDAAKFYAARGVTANKYVLLTLLERPSGIGRSILPFIGPRRISSVFLEPVSMGNFAVIIGAWALAKDRIEWRQAVGLMVLAVAVIVLADARFGALAMMLIAAARLGGLWKIRWLHAAFPLMGIVLTVVLASLHQGQAISDDFLGRLLIAGRHLSSLDAGAWLGLPQEIVLDAGYGYVIQQFGIVMCLVMWCVYCLLPMDDQGQRFRFNASVYIALILSVSGSSLFALKTAAILFFLLGSLVVHRAGHHERARGKPLAQPMEPWPI